MKYKQRKQPDGGCFLKVVYNILISYVNRVKVLSNTFYFNYEYLLIFNYYLSIVIISYYYVLLFNKFVVQLQMLPHNSLPIDYL